MFSEAISSRFLLWRPHSALIASPISLSYPSINPLPVQPLVHILLFIFHTDISICPSSQTHPYACFRLRNHTTSLFVPRAFFEGGPYTHMPCIHDPDIKKAHEQIMFMRSVFGPERLGFVGASSLSRVSSGIRSFCLRVFRFPFGAVFCMLIIHGYAVSSVFCIFHTFWSVSPESIFR